MLNLLLKNIRFEFTTGAKETRLSFQADLPTPSMSTKFAEFLREQKLQEPVQDSFLEWKREILCWYEIMNAKKNEMPLLGKFKAEILNTFWDYISKLMKDPQYSKKPLSSIKDLKVALDRELCFYKKIVKISTNPKTSTQKKLEELKAYEDVGMLLNIGDNYHPTFKAAPLFLIFDLFLQIAPCIAAQLAVQNFEDLKIIFDFYCKEIDPTILDFDSNQTPEAFTKKFTNEFIQKIEGFGIKNTYKQQIDNINKELADLKQKKEELKILKEKKEAFLKEQQQQQKQLQKELLNNHKTATESLLKEFNSSASEIRLQETVKIKLQETVENESLERLKTVQQVDAIFLRFLEADLIQKKTITTQALLQSLKAIQKLYQLLHIQPLLIQNIQEPSQRKDILKDKTAEIKALKAQEIEQKKQIEETRKEKIKASFLFSTFDRKQAYQPQETLPLPILELLERASIFNEFFQKKLKKDKEFLVKLEQLSRAHIENDKSNFNNALQIDLLTMISQPQNREKIKQEQDLDFSEISLQMENAKQIHESQKLEEESTRNINLEEFSIPLLKRHNPYGNHKSQKLEEESTRNINLEEFSIPLLKRHNPYGNHKSQKLEEESTGNSNPEELSMQLLKRHNPYGNTEFFWVRNRLQKSIRI